MLVVAGRAEQDSAIARSAEEIQAALEALGRRVVLTHSLDDAEAAVESHPALSCVVLGWGLAAASDEALAQTKRILGRIRQQAASLPVLLGARRGATREVPLEIVEQVEGYIWLPEDSPTFIAGRIDAAARRYLDTVLPPFFGQLANFADTHAYSWHTPGHTGGTAFMKTAVGRAFMAFYGEQMLRSDLSVSVGSLGSLNDHSGPVGEAERFAARVFGADHTFFSIGGSSASNEIILHSSVADGDVVLVDRNCHKSLNYALNMSGAIPVYLRPRRNARGLIGPVPASEIEPEAIRAQARREPAREGRAARRPVLAVLTNSTYDGLCYDVEHTTRALSESVDRIHYDEAWYAYARFNPIYEGRYGMHRGQAVAGRRDRDGDALDAQAAGGAVPGLDDPHPLGTGAGGAGALQRGVHDAHLDLAAVQHHRLDRRLGEDDGRCRPGADGRVHPRSDRLPQGNAAHRPRPRSPQVGRLVVPDLAGRQGRTARPSSMRIPTCSRARATPGCSSRGNAGTASGTWAPATACSTRSRSRR